MRFFSVLVAFILLECVAAYYSQSQTDATTTAAIPSCHALGGGLYTKASVTALSQVGASDIVPPSKGNASKNYSGANVSIFMRNCTNADMTSKPPAPPKPADPNAGKYSLETGPVQ